jgi:phosphohistidine phosphatase SixA
MTTRLRASGTANVCWQQTLGKQLIMKQTLYLLRHAEAEPWSPLGNDFSRPLRPNGMRHAQALAGWAADTLAVPDTILCSPAKRTRETLAPLLSRWPQLLSATDYVDSIYGASTDMLLILAEDAFHYSQRLLMVGHNPGIENTLNRILGAAHAENAQKMAPGTMAVIGFSDGFKLQANSGNLLHLKRHIDFSI